MVWVTSRFRLLMLVVCCHWISASLSAEQHCANACTSLPTGHTTPPFHSLARSRAHLPTPKPDSKAQTRYLGSESVSS
ncbi:hypothetical protein M758_9G080000 [Ceratodon purpureus]|nr:hypothetical protein M758_9G080000 [Ceratodon purpureus]